MAAAVLSAGVALGDAFPRPPPPGVPPPLKRLALAPPIQAIATGIRHTCVVLQEEGKVACWGLNTDGQLGDGTTTTRTTPAIVPMLSGAQQLALGLAHTCALLTNGTVSCWGQSVTGGGRALSPTLVPGLAGVTQLAAGFGHTCARIGNGGARCWGNNLWGQLGDGTTIPRPAPTFVVGLTGVLELAAGWEHSCARLQGGVVKCWGSNTSGQLGNAVPVGPAARSLTPVGVPDLAGLPASSLAAGGAHTCALFPNRSVRCWGANVDGQMGDGSVSQSSRATTVSGLSALQLASGKSGVCALVDGGGVQCWGWFGPPLFEAFGTPHAPALLPTKVLGGSGAELVGVNAIASGGGHACALEQNATVVCWGYNADGELGAPTGTCGTGSAAHACSRAAVAVVWPSPHHP